MSNLYPGGIDVSNHNGLFDWAAWRGHIKFASAKATEGLNFQDAQFARNWEWMKKLKLYRFAYHYGHPDLNPVQQAEYLVRFVKLQGLEAGDNFVLDLEETGGLNPVDVSFWAWVFCTTINKIAPGHRILVYCDPSFAEEGNCAKLGGWGLWIANYGVPAPHVPPPWRYWRFWQTDGVTLDHDVFQGTEDELETYCTSAGKSSPPNN